MLTRLALLAAISATPAVAFAQTAPAAAMLSPAELTAKVKPSLVVVEYNLSTEMGSNEIRGAGIVIDDEGTVMFSALLTPEQIPVDQLTEFKLIIPASQDGKTPKKEIKATFLGRDDRTDLSFVRPTEKADLKPLSFGESKVAIGDPLRSVGILPEGAGYNVYTYSSTVAAVMRGPTPQVLVDGGLCAVGSPVFDAAGNAIGFVAQQTPPPILNANNRQPFAAVDSPPNVFVPASDFLRAFKDLPKTGEPQKLPTTGIGELTGLTEDVAEAYQLEGRAAVEVGDLLPGFPAEKAGIKRGDIILTINGQPLEQGDMPEELPDILSRQLSWMKPGDKVTFGVIKAPGEQPKNVEVTLADRPLDANRMPRYYDETLGFTSRNLSYMDKYNRKLPQDFTGVVVTFVRPSSSAATGTLRNGDVITQLNQKPASDVKGLQDQIEAFRKDKPSDALVLEVQRGAQTQIIRIEPPQK